MRNITLFLCVFAVILIVGCKATDLPPEPRSPNFPVGKAIQIYEGYGAPYDFFDEDKQIAFLSQSVFNLSFELDHLSLEVTTKHQDGYAYRYGYYYTNTGWVKFQFPQSTVRGSNWIKDSSNISLDINTRNITPGENYIITYSCKKYEGGWKCGCVNKNGPCNLWILQTYLYRNVEPDLKNKTAPNETKISSVEAKDVNFLKDSKGLPVAIKLVSIVTLEGTDANYSCKLNYAGELVEAGRDFNAKVSGKRMVTETVTLISPIEGKLDIARWNICCDLKFKKDFNVITQTSVCSK